MDIAQLTNAPREILLSGLRYQVRALTFAEWGALQNWIKDRVDDPVTEALRQVEKARSKGVAVSAEAEATLLRAAREEARAWPPRVMTSRWFELIGSWPGGSVAFLLALLRPFQPSITEEQAKAIDAAVTGEECEAIVAAAIGHDSPKGDAPAPGRTRPTRATRRKGTTGRRTSTA